MLALDTRLPAADRAAAILAAVDPEVRQALVAITATATAADQPFLTADQVAARLGLPRKTIRQYAREGRLPAVKAGRHWLFEWTAVREVVLAGRV